MIIFGGSKINFFSDCVEINIAKVATQGLFLLT